MFFLLLWLAPILLTGMAYYSNFCGLPLFWLVGPVTAQWKWFENSVRPQSRRWAKRHGLDWVFRNRIEAVHLSEGHLPLILTGVICTWAAEKILWCWKQGPAAGWIMICSSDWCDLSLNNWRKSLADVLLLLFLCRHS